MRVGVSTACLYPLETEKALEVLLGAGVKTLEVFVNTFSELEPTYLRLLRKMADDSGARILSLHPFTSGLEGYLFFTDYPRRTAEALDWYRRYFEGVQILGGSMVVFHGAHRASTLPQEEYFRRFAHLAGEARRCGALLCHENVSRSVSWSPRFFAALAESCPSARFVLDIKQAVRAEVDPFQMLAAMKGRVAHVHISDNDEGCSCLPPGRGAMDTARFLRELRDGGYDGALVVELYRENFGKVSELTAAERFLRDSLTEL